MKWFSLSLETKWEEYNQLEATTNLIDEMKIKQ